jgi:hypothetical protein
MNNVELQSIYYTDIIIINIVWRVQKMSPVSVVNVAVGENKKTIVDLQKNDDKLVTLIRNNCGSRCYYIDLLKQKNDVSYVPNVDEIKDIETIARNIVKFLD